MGSQDELDPLRRFADALRNKGGIEIRSAVLDGERQELFRAKDLVRWVKANPDKCTTAAAGKTFDAPEELGKFLGQQLLRRKLVMRVDRLNKKPLPGSKKLVKFPRKLTYLPADQAAVFAEDGFYVWQYELPTSVWTYVWATLIPICVVGACLFPLAPNWAKLGVFYLSSGLLVALLGTLLLRWSVATATWIVSGSSVWLLPNLMSEELPVTHILKPLVSVEGPKEGASKWSNHPLTRLAVGAAVASVLYVLYSHSPDKTSVVTEASRYRDDLMDWLGVQREGYHRISTANDTAAAAANATEADTAAGGAGGAAGGEGVAAGAAAAGAEATAAGAAEEAGAAGAGSEL